MVTVKDTMSSISSLRTKRFLKAHSMVNKLVNILSELAQFSKLMNEYHDFISKYSDHMDIYMLRVKASVTFEEGLKKTIQWYKDNRILWEKQMMMRKVPVKAKDGSIVWY